MVRLAQVSESAGRRRVGATERVTGPILVFAKTSTSISYSLPSTLPQKVSSAGDCLVLVAKRMIGRNTAVRSVSVTLWGEHS